MSEVLSFIRPSLAALAQIILVGLKPQRFGRQQAAVLVGCSLLLSVSWIAAAARPRTRAVPLKFEIAAVDSASGKRKSTFLLGENVSVVFTLTNQSVVARTIPELQDTSIPYKLVSISETEGETEKLTGSCGGTGGSYADPDGTIYWTARQPRTMTLAPGQTVSMKIDDLGRTFARRLGDGRHTLTATYLDRLKAKVSFLIVIDEAKSIPLLEKMAATPAPNGDEYDRIWASGYLKEIRQPSISGLVKDTAGKPLKEVRISVTGAENAAYDTRPNGSYYLDLLTRGSTYTLTPSLRWAGSFDANYTFQPPSRTVTNLNSKLTGVNFTATRVRASTNIASEDEGATARPSSTLGAPDDKFEATNVIDGVKSGEWDHCCNAAWSDATWNIYPDWVEVNFKGTTTIDWINVFTVQDRPGTSSDPTQNETFTKEGITDFDVQYWNGRVWKNVPGGVIRGNRNVWRKIAFPTITTNKIRVVVRKALSGHSRIMEIEAFHINDLPVVKLTGRSKGRTGSSFLFHTKASDRDWAIHKYTLDFGDGTPNYELEYGYKPVMKELNLTHTHKYAKAGTYTVTLSAVDHDDEGSETAMTVTVTDPPQPPKAEASAPPEGITCADIFFEGRASFDPDGRIVRYRWNFGDGTTANGPTASHKFTKLGTYEVTLMVVDNDGQTARSTVLVRINPGHPTP